MLPGLSMACSGTGTQPVAKVAWSAHMAFRPLGSRMAMRAAAGSCMAARAWAHVPTRWAVSAQVKLVQAWEVVSKARYASELGVRAARRSEEHTSELQSQFH